MELSMANPMLSSFLILFEAQGCLFLSGLWAFVAYL